MKDVRINRIPLLSGTAILLILGFCTCSSDLSDALTAQEGTPVTVVAEIAAQTKAAADNGYDRSEFVNGDKIRVFKKYGSSVTQQVDYSYNGTSSWTTATSPITLQATALYYAVYPSDYSGIKLNQSAQANYIASNKLQTAEVTSRDGILKFTGAGAFKHTNVKLSLTFVSGTGTALSGAFSTMLVSGAGIIGGSSTTENITLYRPIANAYSWYGILYPKGSDTGISVSLTYGGVLYNVKLTCGMKAGTHYNYTLTIENNKVVPTGSTIQDWTSENVSNPGELM